MKNKLLVIIGPTATGKSDIAIKLAQEFNGEIISADSRQIYKGLDIGSGKVTKSEQKLIKHHLLDIVSPKKQFSVAEYQNLVYKKLKQIWNKKKIPIICGGSPLYIISVLEGWQFPKTKINLKLRNQLESKTLVELTNLLKKQDPERFKTIDQKNKRRIIRALEIISSTKKEVTPLAKKPLNANILILSTQKDKTELKNLIKQRLDRRLQEGMLEEVTKLKKQGLKAEKLDSFGLEYRYLNQYLDNKISYTEMYDTLYKKIVDFSKRQITWFKKFPDVKYIESISEAIKLTRNFFSSHE